jgi:hypothetical protein
MKLTGIQPLIDMVALSLQSAFVGEPNGVSLLIISKPETGKTSTVFHFHNLEFVSYYDEITAKKIIDEFLPLVKTGQKRTLIIPDLINCVEKQKSTREQFLSIIKSGIDDTGIVAISTYHKQLQFYKLIEGLRFNIITAVTGANFMKVQRYLKDTGLLSRFLPFSYDYPVNLVQKVFEMIEGKATNDTVQIPKLILKETPIPNNPALFKNFEFISTRLGIDYGGYGIRAQIGFQRLAKANALMNKRKEVTKEDIEKVIELSRWINYGFNPL